MTKISERQFREYENNYNKKMNSVGLLTGLFLFNMYFIADVIYVPEIIEISFLVRAGLVTPIMLSYFIFRNWALESDPASINHEIAYTVGGIIITILYFIVFSSISFASTSLYLMHVAAMITYMNTVHRKPFFLHAVGTVGCLMVACIGMYQLPITPPGGETALISLLTISLISLFAAYRINQAVRRDFITTWRERSMRAELLRINLELQHTSNTDELTRIPNRRAFDRTASAVDQRKLDNFAIIFIDVDYFKNFNDSLGHTVGDDCLKQIAICMQAALENTEHMLARYGGEEFAILLEDCVPDDVQALAERLRRCVYDLNIKHPARQDNLKNVTISVGWSMKLAQTETTVDVMMRADDALYDAKDRGRNCSVSHLKRLA
ncbi:diguanylate cyclase [Rhizobium sp. CFBP 8762]|uniref:GGDEF domain-containing protein n=1 Tax=Rhizobium sp. CFBP 8762 TaxID=2775279 RepID=UPI0017828945|nr:diguanylate cyclase [Rhizobium sp. CFBP 8762]MBD8556412.1 diguanylate cyclase [Rhizobium sp. CFBP 8762]